MPRLLRLLITAFLLGLLSGCSKGPSKNAKHILFLPGKDSHGPGLHEHIAGSHLLATSLNESGLDVYATVANEDTWRESMNARPAPDAIVMYCDGYTGHPAKAHQAQIQELVDHGVGVVCLHFAVEVAPDELGAQFIEWIGGYFEIEWSVNPIWEAHFEDLPEHPITRGVAPFFIRDEWYYHMRFKPNMEGITPILSAVPPLRSLTSRSKEPLRGSNPEVMAKVKAGQAQHLAWALERPDGGRGFGFTGGHYHENWQNENFRKLVLNAILWTAHYEVPILGVSP